MGSDEMSQVTFMYQCVNSQRAWTQLSPIHFKVNGAEGVNLADAVNPHFNGLGYPDDLAFTDESIAERECVSLLIVTSTVTQSAQSVHGIRGTRQGRTGMAFQIVRLCSYGKRNEQITTKDYKRDWIRITRRKLACEVAKCRGAPLPTRRYVPYQAYTHVG